MRRTRRLLTRVLPVVGLGGALVAGMLGPSEASSHREAPTISKDPVADLTDVYAFVSPDAPGMLNLVANVNPFEEPAGGPNFHMFGDDVRYELRVDNDGDAFTDVKYEFRFKTQVRNPGTFLYNTNQVTSLDDPDLSVVQTYSVHERKNGRSRTLARNLVVPPPNIGPRSTPNYAALAAQGVYDIGGGTKVFAGPRDDPFFVDLGSIFDLGGLRPFNQNHLIPLPNAPGKDYVAGYNVHTFAIQIPIANVVDEDPVIGVWATTLRRSQRNIATDRSGVVTNSGTWVVVSRLGMPLVNEVVVDLANKDRFNASRPRGDAQFLPRVLNPELAGLIEVLYPGVDVPEEVDLGLGLGGREDIATIFLTGIPGVNQPANVRPSEMLRINTGTATGFPNGRLLTDDVTDVEIRALAGATAFSPDFNVPPNNQLGDGVNANDRPFLPAFPYLATPHNGYAS